MAKILRSFYQLAHWMDSVSYLSVRAISRLKLNVKTLCQNRYSFVVNLNPFSSECHCPQQGQPSLSARGSVYKHNTAPPLHADLLGSPQSLQQAQHMDITTLSRNISQRKIKISNQHTKVWPQKCFFSNKNDFYGIFLLILLRKYNKYKSFFLRTHKGAVLHDKFVSSSPPRARLAH